MALLDTTAARRMTPAGLTSKLRRHHPHVTRRSIRKAIQALVEHGELTYSDRFGRTYIEKNYLRRIRITDRITLSPPHCNPAEQPGQVVVKLHHGVSFGMGDHPTTRIALRGVERALARLVSTSESCCIAALDIGTGSGVLAIAAIKLGAARAFGLDVEPVACHEARRNVALNGLDDSVTIHQTMLDRFVGERCDLIIANLRPPTLRQIIPVLHRFSTSQPFWVFSGYRKEEARGINALLARIRADVVWEYSEHGWSGMVIQGSSKGRGT
jgi:ribosomal protein L11 methyltransferase